MSEDLEKSKDEGAEDFVAPETGANLSKEYSSQKERYDDVEAINELLRSTKSDKECSSQDEFVEGFKKTTDTLKPLLEKYDFSSPEGFKDPELGDHLTMKYNDLMIAGYELANKIITFEK